MASPISVGIVEDDERIRESLRMLLSGVTTLRCVGAWSSAEEALRDLPGLRPAVVLMDLNLPGMDGIEAVRRLRQVAPGTAVLMLTVYEDAERVFRALQAGATGYLVKRTAPHKLIAAIEEVQAGGAPLSPQVARLVVQHFHRQAPAAAATEKLSPREAEILAQLARGYLYKEIASQLGIGVETVRSHISSIYGKLQVHTRTEAVVKFLGQPPRPAGT